MELEIYDDVVQLNYVGKTLNDGLWGNGVVIFPATLGVLILEVISEDETGLWKSKDISEEAKVWR